MLGHDGHDRPVLAVGVGEAEEGQIVALGGTAREDDLRGVAGAEALGDPLAGALDPASARQP
jgi:hypothetical protein